MNEQELDEVYGDFCRKLSVVGEAQATPYLARFALLAFHAIDDANRIRTLIEEAGADPAAEVIP